MPTIYRCILLLILIIFINQLSIAYFILHVSSSSSLYFRISTPTSANPRFLSTCTLPNPTYTILLTLLTPNQLIQSPSSTNFLILHLLFFGSYSLTATFVNIQLLLLNQMILCIPCSSSLTFILFFFFFLFYLTLPSIHSIIVVFFIIFWHAFLVVLPSFPIFILLCYISASKILGSMSYF